MKKSLFSLVALLLLTLSTNAQKKFSAYAVGFYNQENLFDTCHDEGKNDYQYLPDGSYHWDGLKYSHKLHNMARALSDMGTDVLPGVGCAVIGLSEIENAKVLTDLCAQPELAQRGMKFCHIEGPDKRGVDCGLLYNPSLFKVDSVFLPLYKPELEKDSAFTTRGFLTVQGQMAGEPVTFIVCHWPSRFSTSYYRELGAKQVKQLKDSIMASNPTMKIFVMGDMNDDPTDASMYKILSAKGEIDEVGEGDMYNPWYNILVKQGTGTLMYNGSWNLFDQIVMSPNLLVRAKNKMTEYTSLKYWKNAVQRMPYLFQTEGKYKGSPKRTTAGGVWLDGFSDHLPVCVYLLKEQQ